MSLGASILIALIHVYIFSMESLLWGTEKVNKTFRVKPENIEILRLWAFNQGFYNLFLSLGIFVGAGFIYFGKSLEGRILIDFAVASVFFAGLVLAYSTGQVKSSLIQSGPAVIYFLLRVAGF